jgi:hypothetical protein
MDEKTIEQLEGVAALDRRHHEVGHKCLCLLWVVLAVLISGAAVGLWDSMTRADLRQVIAEQQATISAMANTIDKLQ